MHSEKRSRKLSEAGKGRPSFTKGIKYSEERCKKMSLIMKEMYNSPKGEIVKNKIRKTRINQVITEETKKKISEANKGKLKSEETKKRMSDAQKGRILTKETKQKIREARMKQAPMGEESKLKYKKSIQIYWKSEEGKKQKEINSQIQKQFKHTKGLHWFNDGIKNIMAEKCPDGCVPGRLGNFKCFEENKLKKSEWYKNLSEEERIEHNRKAAEARRGHHFTDEQKKHIGDANRGRKYYNNGIIEVMRFEQPEGFIPGRLPSVKQKIKEVFQKNNELYN